MVTDAIEAEEELPNNPFCYSEVLSIINFKPTDSKREKNLEICTSINELWNKLVVGCRIYLIERQRPDYIYKYLNITDEYKSNNYNTIDKGAIIIFKSSRLITFRTDKTVVGSISKADLISRSIVIKSFEYPKN